MQSIGNIVGAELLTSIFGYWPSFHDAEVIWLRLDRGGPTLEVLIHTFEMTSEVDPQGYYGSRHHVLTHLRFDRFAQLEIKEFNHQNALMGLRLEDVRDRQLEGIAWQVSFDPAWGLCGSFQCASFEVISVTPCDKAGKPIN